MAVFAEDGEPLGALAEIVEAPGNDVYIIRKEGARDLLIPALKEVIVRMDVPATRMGRSPDSRSALKISFAPKSRPPRPIP